MKKRMWQQQKAIQLFTIVVAKNVLLPMKSNNISSILLSTNSEMAKDELYSQRKADVKITADSMCSLCNKKIGTSVFAVYPNGNTIVHFVCFRDSQSMKATGKDLVVICLLPPRGSQRRSVFYSLDSTAKAPKSSV
ncbi:Vam6/Vps39-like protein [Tanacetum coccineum]